MHARQSVTSWRVTAPAGKSAKSSTSFFEGLALAAFVESEVGFEIFAAVAFEVFAAVAFDTPAVFAVRAVEGFDRAAVFAADAFGLAGDFEDLAADAFLGFAAGVGFAAFAEAPVFLVAADFFAAPALVFVAAIV